MEKKINNTADLRSTLVDVLNGLRDKTIDEKTARAIAGVTSQILSSARLDLQAARFYRSEGPKPTALSSADTAMRLTE